MESLLESYNINNLSFIILQIAMKCRLSANMYAVCVDEFIYSNYNK